MEKECFAVIKKLDSFVIQQCQIVQNLSWENQALKSLYFNSLLKEIQMKKEKREKSYEVQKVLKNKYTQTSLVQPLTISIRRLTKQQCKDIELAQNKHRKAQAVEKILNHKDTQTSLNNNQPLTISLRRITRQQSVISKK